MQTSGNFINETDQMFINGLKAGDARVIYMFFYGELRKVISYIRGVVYHNRIGYDEIVSELYLFLACGNWAKLDTFKGQNASRLSSWMASVAWRRMVACYHSLMPRENGRCDDQPNDTAVSDDLRIEIMTDVMSVLAAMPNRRYAMLLQLLLIDGLSHDEVAAMWSTQKANVANLRHRAIAQFVKVYGRR